MWRYLLLLLLTVLTGVWQTTVFPAWGFAIRAYFFLPLLILSLVIFLADFETTLFYALFLGLFMDLYSLKFFGFYMVSFTVVVVLSRFLVRHYFDHKKFITLLAANIISVLLWHLLYILLNIGRIFSQPELLWPAYLSVAGAQLITHALLAWLLYRLIPRLRNSLAPALKA